MVDGTPREGWGVSTLGAALLVLGFFGALAAFIAGVGLFYSLNTASPHAPGPSLDPAPRLQTAQRHPDDHLPAVASGPPQPTPDQARAIRWATARLLAEGDKGWAALTPGRAP